MTENSEQTSFCIRDGARQINVIGPVWPVRQPDGSYMLYTSKPDGYEQSKLDASRLADDVMRIMFQDRPQKYQTQDPTETQPPA